MIWHTYFNPAGISGNGVVNTEAWRLAQIPSTNGHGTARAVACIGCGICEHECPVLDDAAVYVTAIGETRSEDRTLLLENRKKGVT